MSGIGVVTTRTDHREVLVRHANVFLTSRGRLALATLVVEDGWSFAAPPNGSNAHRRRRRSGPTATAPRKEAAWWTARRAEPA